MAVMNFGGVEENVVTREEFPLEKAREVLKDEVIAVLGYGVQGPGQSLNLRDNGFNVIVGQRPGKTYDKAVADGWVPGETLFSIEEACEKATIIQVLLSDAAQIACWPTIKKHLTAGKALYFSHGFAITYSDRTHIVPPADVDVIMIAPKGSGTSLRRMFLQGRIWHRHFPVPWKIYQTYNKSRQTKAFRCKPACRTDLSYSSSLRYGRKHLPDSVRRNKPLRSLPRRE